MNYNLVISSKFNPLTFQEMLYPFEKYGEAYKEQEEALAELGAKASVWDNMVNSDTNSTSYNLINTYNTDLAAQRDALAKQGLDVNSRRKLLELRMRYGKEVDAVEKAYNAREEVRKLQEQAYINSGGNIRFSTYANQQSIDEYLNGKRPTYYTANLNTIMQDAASQAKSIAGRYIDSRLFNKGQILDYVQSQGITAENADQILANLFNENTEDTDSQENTNTVNPLPGFNDLRNMVNDIRNKVGYKNFEESDQAAINAAIASGVRTGLGYEEKHNPIQNRDYINLHSLQSSSRSGGGSGSGGNNSKETYYMSDTEPIILDASGITTGEYLKYDSNSKNYKIPKGYKLLADSNVVTLTSKGGALNFLAGWTNDYNVYVKYKDDNNNIEHIILYPKTIQKSQSNSTSTEDNHNSTGAADDSSDDSQNEESEEGGGK